MDDYLEYMGSIDDKDLLLAFEECQSCRNTGILPIGKARSIMNKWVELSGGKLLCKKFQMRWQKDITR